MNSEELKEIRDLLGIGSVEFIEVYLDAKYHTGKKWLSGEIDIPGPVARCAKLWKFLYEKKLSNRALKQIYKEN